MSVKSHTDPQSVLILDEDPNRSATLRQALEDSGDTIVAALTSATQLKSQLERHQPDLIIVGIGSPRHDLLEQMALLNRQYPRPIVMFVEDDDGASAERAIEAGVSAYVVAGLSAKRVKPIVDIAVARFREQQSLRNELAKVKNELAERKLVDRAKALLIKRQGMSEEQAYHALRKLAMDQGKRLSEAARNIIAVLEILE